MMLTDGNRVTPGEHTLVVKGIVGTKSDFFELKLFFINLCDNVKINLTLDGLFEDMTYSIRGPEES